MYICYLSQLKHFVDTPKRKLFYHAHISPHLTYVSTVWDGCSDILFHKLNFLHRTAAKLMISDPSLITSTKLRYLGVLPLKGKLMFKRQCYIQNIKKSCASVSETAFSSVPSLSGHISIHNSAQT